MANNFKHVGALMPNSAPVLRKAIIGNSVVAVTFNAYTITSGFAALAAESNLIFGHAEAVETFAGVGQITTGAAGSSVGSYLGTWTAASNNQTVDKVSILADVSKTSLWGGTLDGTINTTTGSGLLGYFLPLEGATQLDESGALTTTLAYFNWGQDPVAGGNNVIVNIYQSQVFGV